MDEITGVLAYNSDLYEIKTAKREYLLDVSGITADARLTMGEVLPKTHFLLYN